ncbi:hypothetical protein LSCM1_06556 [Leishmania martiniquensis]|uniref:DNA ligase n=1 Tax=Leishmania martiniquensis TaxID=1580590 RepID=A0A836HXM9_9TRYP|nr:hypothetical protein LSCM1_06556 [Leishmania martiniquensis]
MLHPCRRLSNGLPFVPMTLSTLDLLNHRLQAAGLDGAANTAATPMSSATSSAGSRTGKSSESDELKWFSGSFDAPFFISPKHDGIRLISYVPPTTLAALPSSKQASTKAKKTSTATGESSPLMTCYSRNGRPVHGLFWIEEELRLLRALCGDPALIVDGELYLHRTDMEASRAALKPQAEATGGGRQRPERAALAPSNANGARPLPATAGPIHTGFLAVSALVHRLRRPTSRYTNEESVLQYVPALPRLCVFDVPSYSPCADPLAPLTRTASIDISAASHLHASTKSSAMESGVLHPVLAEVQRVRRGALNALRVSDVEQLRIVPNVTPFSQRLRTMNYLFELLSRGVESPVLRQHFCPTLVRMFSAGKRRGVGDHRSRTATAGQMKPPSYGFIEYHGGRFVCRIPYQLVRSLEDTTQRLLPVYLDEGYEGAVVRAPVNTYDFKEKMKGTLAALVAPLLRATETGAARGRRHQRRSKVGGSEASGHRTRIHAALLLSLNSGTALGSVTPLMVRAYRGDTPRIEPVQAVSPSEAGLTDAELDVLDVAAVGRRAVLQSTKLPQRSVTAVKVLTYHDREYPILRPLLKEPSTNLRTRGLVSMSRSQARALGYFIKSSTNIAVSSDGGATRPALATPRHGKKMTGSTASPRADSAVCFYGLQCLAENGLVFNVSLPKLALDQQKRLLQHLLSAGRDTRDDSGAACVTMTRRTKRKLAANASCEEASCASPSKMASLTGLYATVKFSTLTEHGLPRFGSVKAIRGGKGWFM